MHYPMLTLVIRANYGQWAKCILVDCLLLSKAMVQMQIKFKGKISAVQWLREPKQFKQETTRNPELVQTHGLKLANTRCTEFHVSNAARHRSPLKISTLLSFVLSALKCTLAGEARKIRKLVARAMATRYLGSSGNPLRQWHSKLGGLHIFLYLFGTPV